MKVGVLCGGMSREREISLRTGAAVIKAVGKLGYECISIDPGKDAAVRIAEASPDIAFIALHGRYGEDGAIQGTLEILGIPYTGSGVLASAVAMDKIFAKKIFRSSGIPTPDFVVVHNNSAKGWVEGIATGASRVPFGWPYVVKPSREGSSIGITFVDNADSLPAAIRSALTHDDDVLIEKFIAGKELTVGIIGTTSPQALPVIEIAPKSGRYDYESKYTVGATEYIIPPRLPLDVIADAQSLALSAHSALGCQGVSRVDLMLGPEGLDVIEVNTIPGMTETSLLPKAAAAAGLEFHELIDKLINWGLERT